MAPQPRTIHHDMYVLQGNSASFKIVRRRLPMAICAAVCVVAASSDSLVKDPSDDELDDGETVENTGEGVVAGGPMSPPSCAAFF